ncbi:RimK family alpha-L-glutamate ligase [Fulvimarina sp. 2208YS6-2-32]|uniref:RimK family alpha-L-glutamate ligase n=1 Tax=Fulvimarina uroteuthidis TaxID=3098149 RepID=A0ABU5HYP1_9HYPH|nr:RimK family alpha-L-glutamate ligase [Fulvimarina sp. 2208YS6-2-32]MDY8108101.1 RimK family alpha-L-glutamate ligase [Fulvimarina sp. 2208YS6-2-32]
MQNAPRILIVTAAIDRHARQMKTAFEALGAVARFSKLSEIAFDSGSASGFSIPGFGETLPDAICVRTMDGGSFEAVTRRLGILHGLEALGVPVSNSARSIELCVDKAATSFQLRSAGLPSPRSICVERRDDALAAIAAADRPMVLKPLFGSQGKGLKLLRTPEDLPPDEAIEGGVFYLQEFAGKAVGTRWTDFRVLVSDGRAVAGMRREAANWITNIKQGAIALPMEPDGEMERIAVAAAKAVGADFCGVDLLRDGDGAIQLIEVNSMPAWTGLSKVTPIDIAMTRARDLLARLGARDRPGTLAETLLPKAV